jgi:hypothetical protein
MRDMGLDPRDIARRKQLVGLGAEDQRRIAAIRPLVLEHVEAFTRTFFDALSGLEEAKRLMSSPELLERARTLKREHLVSMVDGDYGTDAVEEQSASGRRGVGTTNHCMHGKDAVVEEILDWQPYEAWTTRSTMPIPGLPKLVMTETLTELPDGGTRIEIRLGRPRPRDREAFEQLRTIVDPMFQRGMDRLAEVLRDEAARAKDVTVDEPPLPVSGGRYLAPQPALDTPASERVDSTPVHSSSS